jgi:hypothetical protein
VLHMLLPSAVSKLALMLCPVPVPRPLVLHGCGLHPVPLCTRPPSPVLNSTKAKFLSLFMYTLTTLLPASAAHTRGREEGGGGFSNRSWVQ